MAVHYATIPAEKTNSSYGVVKPIACICNEGRSVVVYRNELEFLLYKCAFDSEEAIKITTIKLDREMSRRHIDLSPEDQVQEMRFLTDNKQFRVGYHSHPSNFFWIDTNISDLSTHVTRGRRYRDKSILGCQDSWIKGYKQMRENAAVLIEEETHVGNLI